MITIPNSASRTAAGSAAAAGAATSQTAQTAQPGGAMGKDEFLKLLIAQMQNQDPMNPMQGDQMAAQLAQFSSLEQLQEINSTLSGQSTANGTLLGAIQSNAAIGTIGHNVIAVGDQIQVGSANPTTSVTADINANGTSATLQVLDANRHVVGSRDLGAVNAGRQTFDLGGATDGLAPGNYTYAIDVKDASGSPIAVQTYMSGRVDGISSGANGLTLNIGNLTVPYANIVSVMN